MSNLTVAKTILEQLGGNKFCMMTGAKNLAGDENSLSNENWSKQFKFKLFENHIELNGFIRYEIL